MLRRKATAQINKLTNNSSTASSIEKASSLRKSSNVTVTGGGGIGSGNGSGRGRCLFSKKSRTKNMFLVLLFGSIVNYFFLSNYTMIIQKKDRGKDSYITQKDTALESFVSSKTIVDDEKHVKEPIPKIAINEGSIEEIKDQEKALVGREKITNTSGKMKEMKHVIMREMNAKLNDMPSPAWPQLDHRTAEAMASGVIIGVENITEFNFNHTIGKFRKWQNNLEPTP